MQFIAIRPALGVAALVVSLSWFAATAQPVAGQQDPHPRRIYGVLIAADAANNTISLRRRDGRIVVLDISQAARRGQLGVLPINRPISVWGVRGTDKTFHVQSIGHAAPLQSEWGTDTDPGD